MRLTTNRPIVCLITSGRSTPQNVATKGQSILELICAAAAANIDLVQIREKNISARALYELAIEAMRAVRGSETRVLINDRADIARAAGADGVHLTSRSMTPRAIRKAFGDDLVIGVSVHTVEEAAEASLDGSDFAVYAPVFSSPGKGDPQGTQNLADACRRADPLPVLALGGVNEENYENALDAGAAGIAAIRMFEDAGRLAQIADRIRSKIS